MKKYFIFAIMFIAASSTVFAAPFSPTLLKLSAQNTIHYNFDGSTLEIPVSVSGTPALATFFVYTKDMADQIADIRNGFLGWHYVNKIDTCIYFSDVNSFDVGNHTITWDGKDQDGNALSAGDYTYYIWAFDNQNQKQKVMYFAKDEEGEGQDAFFPYLGTNIEEFDENGSPLANPVFHQAAKKWVIGNDPVDMAMLETTNIGLPEGYSIVRRSVFDPTDHKYFYIMINSQDAATQKVHKWQWVPNGDAVWESNWGVDLVFTNPHYGGSGPGTNGDILYAGYYGQYEDGTNINFYTIDFDGTLIKTFDMSEWWAHPDDFAAGAQMSGGPRTMDVRHGYAFLNHFGSCIKGMVNPTVEDEDDFFSWINQNGDYIVDHNFEEDADKPWVCFDFNVGPYNYTMGADDNHFSITPCYDLGGVSFALLGPDGTGIDYFSFAGETAGWKKGVDYCDNGSAYDGIYSDNQSAGGSHEDWEASEFTIGTYFISHDSIRGVITSQVGVEEDGPESFSVAQNSPNPFNPSTTISFTIADAGNVSIDIFNVAGQKVHTIANEFMSAGSHSVTWDASGFSASVYFYTVKAGEFSKTMKMTLLK